MNKYRISKYDPEYRNADGIYTADEWTSISDIGGVFGGKKFTAEEYDETENNYIKFISEIFDISGGNEFCVHDLGFDEDGYRVLTDVVGLKTLDRSYVKGKVRLTKEQAFEFLRQSLREKCWGVVKNNKIAFDVGYDYYLHLSADIDHKTVTEVAKRHCLFVEDKNPHPKTGSRKHQMRGRTLYKKFRTLTDEDKRFIAENIPDYKESGFDLDNYENAAKDTIFEMTDRLGELIGYDIIEGDIDKTGKYADDIISKLLTILEYRNEI